MYYHFYLEAEELLKKAQASVRIDRSFVLARAGLISLAKAELYGAPKEPLQRLLDELTFEVDGGRFRRGNA